MRWDYSIHSAAELRAATVVVTSLATGKHVTCHPADWGPNEDTGRIIDLSPGALHAIGGKTDDEVIVVVSWDDGIEPKEKPANVEGVL